MPSDLQFVTSAVEIRQSLDNFQRQVAAFPAIGKSLIAHTTFWVFDPQSARFGPSKFVGLRDMNFESYSRARASKDLGGTFDGHATRRNIEQVIGAVYHADDGLSNALRTWAESTFPSRPSVLSGVDVSKWRFISLPSAAVIRARAEPWSDDEIAATVADYMDMLGLELQGLPFSKAQHRKALLMKLPKRDGPAVEFKHCNISAILQGMDLPFVQGYKPRGNYQRALAAAVEAWLSVNRKGFAAAIESLERPLEMPPDGSSVRFADIVERPPEPSMTRDEDGTFRNQRGRFTDWSQADMQNRQLGEQGEQFVLSLERRRLRESGRDDLAERIEWTARDRGDGVGYDVQSFEVNGDRKYIEVKTTRGPKTTPFFLTATELRCAERLNGKYWIYRLFHFGRKTKLYTVVSPLERHLRLEPKVYAARVG